MGGFWSKIYAKKEVRILIQGLDAAGKTTMLYRLKLGEVVTTIPTIGFNVETINHKNIALTVWDVGGRDKIRPLYRHYYQNTDALIFMVDSADHERLEEIKEEMHRALKEESLKDIPVLILANKQDLINAMSTTALVEKLDLHGLRNRPWYIVGTVATQGDGLFEGLDWLTSQIKTQMAKTSWSLCSSTQNTTASGKETTKKEQDKSYFLSNIAKVWKYISKA